MHEARLTSYYLSLMPGFLPCSLRPFRMSTSAWARLPVLGDYGSRDIIASHVARLFRYRNIADSRKAKLIIAKGNKIKKVKQNFNQELKQAKEERGFLSRLKPWVSTSSFL